MSKLKEFTKQVLERLSKKMAEQRVVVAAGGALLISSLIDILATNFILDIGPYKVAIALLGAILISAFLKESEQKEGKEN